MVISFAVSETESARGADMPCYETLEAIDSLDTWVTSFPRNFTSDELWSSALLLVEPNPPEGQICHTIKLSMDSTR